MINVQRLAILLLSAWVLLATAGCTLLNPTTNLLIEAGHNLNPDSDDQPASVVVRVFELADDEAFLSSDFFR
ncbi:MAG: type VI secretion system lipoprotein TssJ, partial [Halomonadaceae bacterium]